MERWGYAAIGFAAILSAPAAFCWLYFSTLSAKDMREVGGAYKSSRAVNENVGSRGTKTTYFEVELEGLAVPIRFHSPAFDPDDPDAPLDPSGFSPPKGASVRVSVAVNDEDKLENPPKYEPWRWIEGYSLETQQKTYLSLEEGIEVWSKNRKLGLYLSGGFTLLIFGLPLLILVSALESSSEKTNPYLKVDKTAAGRASVFYYVFFSGLLFLNIPALGLASPYRWSFDFRFWAVLTAVAVGLQGLLFFHHRRYLRISDSKPRSDEDAPAGFLSYLVTVLFFCLLLTPILQGMASLIR